MSLSPPGVAPTLPGAGGPPRAGADLRAPGAAVAGFASLFSAFEAGAGTEGEAPADLAPGDTLPAADDLPPEPAAEDVLAMLQLLRDAQSDTLLPGAAGAAAAGPEAAAETPVVTPAWARGLARAPAVAADGNTAAEPRPMGEDPPAAKPGAQAIAPDPAASRASAPAPDFSATLRDASGTGLPLPGPGTAPGTPLSTPVRADGLLAPAGTQPGAGAEDPFTEGVGARLAWMAGQKIGRAEIRLNPAELGTIDIRLDLDGKQVRAEFGSAHADVRAALEAGMSRLRDMLASQGLQLTHAGVGGDTPSDQAADRRGQAAGAGILSRPDADAAETASETTAAAPAMRHIGLLDEYA